VRVWKNHAINITGETLCLKKETDRVIKPYPAVIKLT
jgi:hypothetical protein